MRRKATLIAALLALALVAAACGGDSDDTTTTTGGGTATTTTAPMDDEVSELGLPIVDPLDVPQGTVAIAGSSTVYPLSLAIIDQWIDEGGPEYSIDSIGSGGGIDRFCVDGASDIANASRDIQQDERDQCASIGREVIDIRVGTDALSLVISNGNYFAQELTLEEIATAFSLPAGSTWDQVNPDFPAHPIQTFSPGTDSGTFDYFNEVVFDEAEPSPILSSGAEIVGEDDNLTVRGVSEDGCTESDLSSTCAIGYFGYAYYQQNASVLHAVAIDGGDGPIAPSAESVNANTYPIARPLNMYTSVNVVAEKPQVALFIAYYLNNVNDLIDEVGYFPAPQETLQQAADNIKAAAGW